MVEVASIHVPLSFVVIHVPLLFVVIHGNCQ